MKHRKLWDRDAPVYQPLEDQGIHYREVPSDTYAIGWYRLTEGRSLAYMRAVGAGELATSCVLAREEVMALLGATAAELQEWEEAVEQEVKNAEEPLDDDW